MNRIENMDKVEKCSKLKKGQSIENIDKNGHNWWNCTTSNESYKLKLILSKLKIQTFLAHSKTLCAYVTIIHKAINLSQKKLFMNKCRFQIGWWHSQVGVTTLSILGSHLGICLVQRLFLWHLPTLYEMNRKDEQHNT